MVRDQGEVILLCFCDALGQNERKETSKAFMGRQLNQQNIDTFWLRLRAVPLEWFIDFTQFSLDS